MGEGGAAVLVEYPGGRLEVGAGKPLDLAIVGELGLKLGAATPWGLPVLPYAEAPWDCTRCLLGLDSVVDLLSEPAPGGRVALRLEAPPKSLRKRMYRIGGKRGGERGASGHKGVLLPPSRASAASPAEVRADVLVVGGGLSGLSAALAAGEAGSSVVLVNFPERLGGFMAGLSSPSELEGGSRTSEEIVAEMVSRVEGSDGIRVLPGSTLVYSPREGLYVVEGSDGLLLVRAKAVVVATGGLDARPVFAGNWLPGVVSSSYAMRLARASVRLRSVAVVGWNDWALRLAGFLASRYADRVVLVTKRSIEPGMPFYDYAAEYGVEMVVDRVLRARPDAEGIQLDFREYESIIVDAVVSAIGPYPDALTPLALGSRVSYLDSTRTLTVSIGENLSFSGSSRVFAAGLAAGFVGEASAYWSGRLAGVAAAAAAGRVREEDVAVERAELMRHPQAADRIAEARSPGGSTPLVEPDMFVAPGVTPDQALARCPPVWLDELDAYLRATRSPAAAVEAVRLAENLDAGREALPAVIQFSSMILGLPPASVAEEVAGLLRPFPGLARVSYLAAAS